MLKHFHDFILNANNLSFRVPFSESAIMTQGEEWPVKFSFHPAEEESSEETDVS